MIKIKSFSPVDNFTRRSWEFYDDRMVIKTKSLTIDYKDEVAYQKIKSIQSKSMRDINWIWASFITALVVGIAKMGLDYFCLNNPIIDVIKKIVVISGLVMIPLAFLKYEYYSFLDADKNYLATVRVGKKNKQTLLEAVKLIKQKTALEDETYFDDPLPTDTPVYQFSEFDFADFLNRDKVSIYDDKLISVEKSLVEEVTTVVRFDQLSGKTTFFKMGNDNWDHVWSYWLFFVCISGISIITFFPEWVKGNHLFGNLSFGGFALLIPLILMRYIKNYTLAFLNKQDNIVFWTRVNSANREKLNQIVEFVKGKVEPKE